MVGCACAVSRRFRGRSRGARRCSTRAAAAEMRAVSGAVVSSKPMALPKAARVFSRFAASNALGLPAGAGALVLRAAELDAFRRAARVGPDGDGEGDGNGNAAPSGEKLGKKKRRKTQREAAFLEQQ